ncbi:MAG: hypothetical protein AAGF85_17365 [Bacteroidota bacterium]
MDTDSLYYEISELVIHFSNSGSDEGKNQKIDIEKRHRSKAKNAK